MANHDLPPGGDTPLPPSRAADAERAARESVAADLRVLASRVAKSRERAARRRTRRTYGTALRVGLVVAIAAGLAAAGWTVVERRQRWLRVDRALDRLAEPYRARGFEAERPKLSSSSGVEVDVEAARCFVALGVGSEQAAPLEARVGSETISGRASVAFCTCGPATVEVRALGTGPEVGLRVLSIDALAFGGAARLHTLAPLPSALGSASSECSDPQLDAWIAAGSADEPPPGDAWLRASAERGALARAGARVVAVLPASRPFVVVPAAEASCSLAVSSAPRDAIALRLPGGERPLGDGARAVAWCGDALPRASLWRVGEGEVTVVALASPRIGGALGLRELAQRAGVGAVAVWVSPADRARTAADALGASGAPRSTHRPASVTGERARVASIALGPGEAAMPEGRADAAPRCDPPLAVGPSEALCVQTPGQAWRFVGPSAAGVVAPLPLWMSVLAPVVDERVVPVQLALLALARRLAAEGYEPTTLEGAIETDAGVDVTGRHGEDAAVVVGIAAVAPWAFPYCDGAFWSLGEEPLPVALRPAEKVSLATPEAAKIPRDRRRTVVFRRTARPGEP